MGAAAAAVDAAIWLIYATADNSRIGDPCCCRFASIWYGIKMLAVANKADCIPDPYGLLYTEDSTDLSVRWCETLCCLIISGQPDSTLLQTQESNQLTSESTSLLLAMTTLQSRYVAAG